MPTVGIVLVGDAVTGMVACPPGATATLARDALREVKREELAVETRLRLE